MVHLNPFLLLILLMRAFYAIKLDEIDSGFDLGAKHGLTSTSNLSNDMVQKILQGAEAGNKEQIYFLGLLKLYGISLAKNVEVNLLKISNNIISFIDIAYFNLST